MQPQELCPSKVFADIARLWQRRLLFAVGAAALGGECWPAEHRQASAREAGAGERGPATQQVQAIFAFTARFTAAAGAAINPSMHTPSVCMMTCRHAAGVLAARPRPPNSARSPSVQATTSSATRTASLHRLELSRRSWSVSEFRAGALLDCYVYELSSGRASIAAVLSLQGLAFIAPPSMHLDHPLLLLLQPGSRRRARAMQLTDL